MKSKGGSQGLYRNAVDHIKNFDDDDPGRKTLMQEKCFAAWVIIIIIFNVINSIPAQALAVPFWFNICFIKVFFLNFFIAMVFLVGILSYMYVSTFKQ